MNYGEIEVATFTSKGNKSVNEDYFYVRQTKMGLLCMVCDGLGGNEVGRDAAEVAVKTLSEYISTQPGHHDPSLVIEDALMAAHAAVSDLNINRENKGGTTCVAVLIRDKEAWVLNVGNSRCYVIRGSRIAYRTADHSYVADLVRRGQASEEMARTSRYANVLTQAVGITENIKVNVNEIRLERGDRIVLLTDGAWMKYPEKRLLQILSCDDHIEDIVSTLSTFSEEANNSTNTRDDATGIIIGLPGREEVNRTLSVLMQDNLLGSAAEDISDISEGSEVFEEYYLSVGEDEEPAEDKYEYNVSEPGEDEETRGNKRYITWSLAVCLLIAASLIVYLAVGLNQRKRELIISSQNIPTDSISTVNISDSTLTGSTLSGTSETEDTSPDNGFMQSAIANNEVTPKVNEQTVLVSEETEELSNVETETPIEDNSVSYEAIRKAGENLKALRDYDPQSISKKDSRTRRQKRIELFTATVTLLKEAIGATENNQLKAYITEVGTQLTDPTTKNIILKMDEETGCTTREGVKMIDSFRERLMEILP